MARANAKEKIALVGFGIMGRTLAGGLVRSKRFAPESVTVTARARGKAAEGAEALGVALFSDNAAAARGAGVVVLCLKPREVPKVLDELASGKALDHKPLLVSIAAGVSTQQIEERIPAGVPVVRAMPNTPCLIGKGMTVVSRGSCATETHAKAAMALFATVGRVLELDEKHMDTVTGLSASGPAFIYLIIEALADGGVMRGVPRSVATELVAQMTLGASEMVLTTGKHPAALKDEVTTPAGCTIAGILALEDGKIRSVLARAVETASRVAGGLGR
jgi:pyrroline-5-carboxylate reductase